MRVVKQIIKNALILICFRVRAFLLGILEDLFSGSYFLLYIRFFVEIKHFLHWNGKFPVF